MNWTQEAAKEFTENATAGFTVTWQWILFAHKEGVPKAMGLSTRQWVETHFGGYLRLPVAERRQAAKELVEKEGLTQREAADVLGIDHATVHRDLGADAPASMVDEVIDQPKRLKSGADAPAQHRTCPTCGRPFPTGKE
jgi:hypothetical protein